MKQPPIRRLALDAGAFFLLGVLVLLIYWPAMRGQLLWDDPAHVTRLGLQSLEGLGRIWFEPGATQQYYPVLHSVFWLEHKLWGDATAPYHLVNVLLHALNCGLLALSLRRLWQSTATTAGLAGRGIEWVAALLLAVHPVCVESVAWISEQKNTLSTAFCLLALLSYLEFADSRRRASYALATLMFLLALGTKTVTATLAPALLVIIWWQRGRIEWRRDVVPLLPWFALAFAAGLATAWIEYAWIGAHGDGYALTLVQRALLAAKSLWFYVGKLAWPTGLTFFYERWDVAAEAAGWAWHLAAAVAVTVAFWLVRNRSRGPLCAWLLYCGTLFPALGFFNVFPFAFSYVADHFQYLSAFGLIGAAVTAAALLCRRLPRASAMVAVCAAVALAAGLGLAARVESGLYTSNEVLFSANIARNPRSWMGHHVLARTVAKDPVRRDEAIALFRRAIELRHDNPDSMAELAALLVEHPGHGGEAIALLREAVRLRPGFAEAHNSLANELVATPDGLPGAVEHYRIALQLRPRFTLAKANLAQALARMPEGRDEALEIFPEVIRQMPDHVPAHFHYAGLLATIPGREREAIESFEAALRLRPDTIEPRLGLAELLLRLGRAHDAVAQLQAAIALQPDSAVIHAQLAGALAPLPGRLPEALEHYAHALRLAPGMAWARFDYAVLLAGMPDRLDEAGGQASALLELQPEDHDAWNLLGVIRVRQGRAGEARQCWEWALHLRPDFEAARQNLRRLDQSGRP